MKRNTLSLLVIALFIVTVGMAVQVNAANPGIQEHNLPSIQAQASANQRIPIKLPADAKILMKNDKEPVSGRVVKIDGESQELSIQRGNQEQSYPIDKVVFVKSPKDPSSDKDGPLKGDVTAIKDRRETWLNIPINNFYWVEPNKGQAQINPESFSTSILNGIRAAIAGNGKNRWQYVVDEMQFNVQEKTMTIVATPYLIP